MKPAQTRITPKAGADIRAAPGSGRGAAHCLPPDHQGICVILCGVALLLSAGLVNARDIDASSFRCITKMTPVRQFYVDNLQGNLEFFELDVSKDGTKIRKRGTTDVVNRFGGNCFDCHVPAAAQWDLVCETDHGCAPLPVTRAMIRALQRTDPRCDNPTTSPEDAELLKQLEQLLKPPR
jgi:hypothetical protein